MSPQPIKNVILAGLSVAMIWSSQLIQLAQSRDCSIMSVYGANGKTGAGFGIDKTGRVQHSGKGGDAGADATLFNSGPNPHPVCGEVAVLHGAVNIADQTSKSISHGVPTVFPNGSIPIDFFQVNRNGGGPVSCEVSTDATGNSFQPMDMTCNAPGNFGFFPSDRKTWRIVATFKENTVCRGGPKKNLCMVRCRAGSDPSSKEQGICGGCFVVQLDGKVVRKSGGASSSPSSSVSLSLTSQQMQSLISATVQLAKQNNLVATQHKKRGHHQ